MNDEDIPVLKSKQVSIGLTYKKRNWLVSIENFYKNVSGITSKSQGFQNQLEFENLTGTYNTFGTELLIQKQISNITAWVSYAASKNNYIFTTYVPEKFPNNFEIQHFVATGVSYKYQNLNFAVGNKWFTGRPTTLPVNETIINNTITYKEPNSDRLKDYFQTNISASYSHSFKDKCDLKIGASIQNVFNTENVINQFFRINQSTESIEKVNTFFA
ncbi:MAG: TonB-dependent receptor [Flavobacterium sp.]|nr:TonB-dependent receptor [Flavobacterium sp.]